MTRCKNIQHSTEELGNWFTCWALGSCSPLCPDFCANGQICLFLGEDTFLWKSEPHCPGSHRSPWLWELLRVEPSLPGPQKEEAAWRARSIRGVTRGFSRLPPLPTTHSEAVSKDPGPGTQPHESSDHKRLLLPSALWSKNWAMCFVFKPYNSPLWQEALFPF